MPDKHIVILDHARFEMRRRGIRVAEVQAVLLRPGQVLPSRKGRKIYQSKTAGGRMLLRVVLKEEAKVWRVVTAYKTSRVAKYWRAT